MSIYGQVGLLDCPNTRKEEKATHVFSDILWLRYSPPQTIFSFFKCACGRYHKMDREGNVSNLSSEELAWLMKKVDGMEGIKQENKP